MSVRTLDVRIVPYEKQHEQNSHSPKKASLMSMHYAHYRKNTEKMLFVGDRFQFQKKCTKK